LRNHDQPNCRTCRTKTSFVSKRRRSELRWRSHQMPSAHASRSSRPGKRCTVLSCSASRPALALRSASRGCSDKRADGVTLELTDEETAALPQAAEPHDRRRSLPAITACPGAARHSREAAGRSARAATGPAAANRPTTAFVIALGSATVARSRLPPRRRRGCRSWSTRNRSRQSAV
jgi:hypothetical protein